MLFFLHFREYCSYLSLSKPLLNHEDMLQSEGLHFCHFQGHLTYINLLFSHICQSKFVRQDLFIFSSVFTAITPWLLKAKLQSRNYKRWKTHVVRMKKWRSSLKRYLQCKCMYLMYREVLKELFRFLFEEL